jgi:hypothetical protein
LGIRDQITSTVFMGTGDFSWERRILRRAKSQSSIFADFGTSRLRNAPSASVLGFRFSKVPVSESDSLTVIYGGR